jgi:ubiquinone biosynthesis protein UbiJ
LYFALEDLPLNVNFVCTNDRIFVTTDISAGADVDIKLKSSVFLALFQGEDLTELLRQDKIVIHGDVKTAQLLVDLLQQIDIDFEEVLSKYTGDIIAHQVGKLAKSFKASNNPLETLKDELTTLLIAPTKSKLFKNKDA